MSDYQVLVTQTAALMIVDASETVIEKYKKAVRVIASQPELGRKYLPENGDDELPISCRVFALPGCTKSIYYHIDHHEQTIQILGLIDQRRNPAYRFRDVKRDDDLRK